MNVSQPRPLFIRHVDPPITFGCRWCGLLSTAHPNNTVPSRPGHGWECPTREQRDARHAARVSEMMQRRAVVQPYLIGERGPILQSIPAGTRINASEMTPIYMNSEPHANHPKAMVDTCDRSMPHDMRFSAPTSCPPMCPTRMDTR